MIQIFKLIKLGFKHFFKSFFFSNKETEIWGNNFFEKQKGTVTLDYPFQSTTLPEVGRHTLDVKIDDCIVCDLCAKACPVDCIDIQPIRSKEVIGITSDGTKKKIYAGKFDIDMSKCMFCGLCTIPCPTECITMTNQYDINSTKIKDLTYHFSEMTESEKQEKQNQWKQWEKEKEEAKKNFLP